MTSSFRAEEPDRQRVHCQSMARARRCGDRRLLPHIAQLKREHLRLERLNEG